ncbi:MAG: fluoride efflux transporter CrcB, partial [Clostridia bacterium]|nr:fluoride efflux transporter CrcB [Clostridia bacterium]
MNFLFVGLGGALGAMLRYAISLIPYKGDFPILTLITNFLGAVMIGFIAGYAAKKNVPSQAVLFLKTGLCGGFTTFSTFSLEAYLLFENGKILVGGIYAVLSVVLCLCGIL